MKELNTGLKLLIIEALEKIIKLDFPKEISDAGLCYLILDYVESHSKIGYMFAGDILNHVMAKWPKYSGQINFPVPSTNKKYSHGQMYLITKQKYKYKYGKLRLELAQFIIDELTKDILSSEVD